MSMTTVAIWFLWAALAYFALGLTLAILRAARYSDPRIVRNPSDFTRVLERWLQRGYHGVRLRFIHQRTGRYFDFRKYDHGKGDYGAELIFPETGWTREYVPKLKSYCQNMGLTLSSEDAGEGSARRISIDCGGDLKLVLALAHWMWAQILDRKPVSVHKILVGELPLYDETFGHPGYLGVSVDARERSGIRILASRLQRSGIRLGRITTKHDVAKVGSLIFICFLFYLASLVGLPVSTLTTLSQAPDWRLDLGMTIAQGSTITLVFFMTYLVSLIAMRPVRRMIRATRTARMTRAESILRSPQHLFHYALPIAVVLVWIGA